MVLSPAQRAVTSRLQRYSIILTTRVSRLEKEIRKRDRRQREIKVGERIVRRTKGSGTEDKSKMGTDASYKTRRKKS